jgi:hypothetical protein
MWSKKMIGIVGAVIYAVALLLTLASFNVFCPVPFPNYCQLMSSFCCGSDFFLNFTTNCHVPDGIVVFELGPRPTPFDCSGSCWRDFFPIRASPDEIGCIDYI